MTDFEGKPLEVGDEVVFAYSRFKSHTMKRGIVTKVDIKQAGMLMAEININETRNVRAIGHKIYKV